MKRTLAIMAVMMLLAVSFTFSQTIVGSMHDLSFSSTATVRTTTAGATETCVFCHTPHAKTVNTLLWNRTASTAGYAVYASPSMEAIVPQPGAASKNCLSCHDGTVALSSSINNAGTGAGTAPAFSALLNRVTVAGTLDTATSYAGVGTNLSNDHPIGFNYNSHYTTDVSGLYIAAATGTKVTVTGGGVTLPLVGTSLANATMECTSCHNPHTNALGQFKRVSNVQSAMCLACHKK